MVYPNPSHDKATLGFVADKTGEISIQVCDVTGRVMMNLPAESVSEGVHAFGLDVTGMPSGVYFAYLHTSGTMKHAKLVVN